MWGVVEGEVQPCGVEEENGYFEKEIVVVEECSCIVLADEGDDCTVMVDKEQTCGFDEEEYWVMHLDKVVGGEEQIAAADEG